MGFFDNIFGSDKTVLARLDQYERARQSDHLKTTKEFEDMALKLDALLEAAATLITEVGETFDKVNEVLAELKANQQDPSQQAVIDNAVALIAGQAASLDAFQASLGARATDPLPEPEPEPAPEG